MAVEEISAASVGNRAGVNTRLVIGLEDDLKITVGDIDRRMEENRISMEEAMSTLDRIAYQLQSQPLTPEINEERTVQMRKKIHCQSQIKELATKRLQAIEISERSVDGKIVVSGTSYPGCVVIINGAQEKLREEYKDVTYKKNREEIRIMSNKL